MAVVVHVYYRRLGCFLFVAASRPFVALSAVTRTIGRASKEYFFSKVILGSGWGGLSLLQHVDPSLYDITVISPRNHFLVCLPLLIYYHHCDHCPLFIGHNHIVSFLPPHNFCSTSSPLTFFGSCFFVINISVCANVVYAIVTQCYCWYC